MLLEKKHIFRDIIHCLFGYKYPHSSHQHPSTESVPDNQTMYDRYKRLYDKHIISSKFISWTHLNGFDTRNGSYSKWNRNDIWEAAPLWSFLFRYSLVRHFTLMRVAASFRMNEEVGTVERDEEGRDHFWDHPLSRQTFPHYSVAAGVNTLAWSPTLSRESNMAVWRNG